MMGREERTCSRDNLHLRSMNGRPGLSSYLSAVRLSMLGTHSGAQGQTQALPPEVSPGPTTFIYFGPCSKTMVASCLE